MHCEISEHVFLNMLMYRFCAFRVHRYHIMIQDIGTKPPENGNSYGEMKRGALEDFVCKSIQHREIMRKI